MTLWGTPIIYLNALTRVWSIISNHEVIMSSLRQATGSVLSTITETAEAVTSLVNTTATAVHMVNDIVTDQRNKNLKRIAVSNIGFSEALLDNARKEMLTRKIEIKEFLDQDTSYQQMWEEITKEFEGVFDGI